MDDSAYQCPSMTSTDKLTSWCLRQTGLVLSTGKTRSQLANLVKAGKEEQEKKRREIIHDDERFIQQSCGVRHHTTIW
jgi:alpha-tubulin suppressor-like RCC1 family protein